MNTTELTIATDENPYDNTNVNTGQKTSYTNVDVHFPSTLKD